MEATANKMNSKFYYKKSEWRNTRVMSDVWDDECDVYIYDINSREFSVEKTWAGCRTQCDDYKPIEEAVRLGLISQEQFDNELDAHTQKLNAEYEAQKVAWFNERLDELFTNNSSYGCLKAVAKQNNRVTFNIPCEIKGSRKYSGAAIFIRNRHQDAWGGTDEALILTVDKKIINVTYGCVYFSDDTLSALRKLTEARKGDDTSAENIFLTKVCPFIGANITNGAEEDTPESRHQAWLKSEHESLRRWVDGKFSDKSDAEREQITCRIMRKKYGEDYK